MKRNLYLSAMMVIFIMLFSSFGFATDRYVSTAGNDGTGDGTIGNPWLTIQHAITNSNSSDVIHVAAGTYTADFSIPGAKTSLEIVGAGAGSSIIVGVDRVVYTSWPLADPNIEILGNGTKIHGFTIKNPVWSDGYYSSGMVIGATDVEIYDNAFQVAGSDDTDDISQGLQTFATLDISGLNIHDNTFTDLAVSVAGYEGVYINKNIGTGTITIDENTFTGDILRAITTEASNTTISENSIITDLAPAFPGGWEGINIAYPAGSGTVANVTVSGNTVEGATGADGFQYGLVVGNSANTNTFTGIIVTGNFIRGNEVGVRVREDAGQVILYDNSIYSNSLYAIKNDDPGATAINATCCWWGSAVSATISGYMSGTVTYSPYLNDGTDGDLVTTGFQPSASCCATPTSWNLMVTPSTSWATNTQSIVSEGCVVYKVNMTSGQTYTFKTGCSDGATADFDTYIDVYNSSGTGITGNDDGCSSPSYTSTVTWTASGTVAYVKVRGYNTLEYGDFTIAYKYTDPTGVSCKTPPAYDAAVTPAVSGNWYTDAQTLASDECYIYKVTTTVGKDYTFKTGCGDGADADFDTFIELFDASGTLVDGNDDGCTDYRSTITWTATETSAYVKVRGYNSSKYGDYTVAYKFTDAAAVGTCVTITGDPGDHDETISVAAVDLAEDTWATDGSTAIISEECYVYKMTGIVSGKSYTFKTGCGTGAPDLATADFDTWLELYDEDGTSLASNDDGCSEYRSTVTWTATYSGFVYVKVRGYDASDYGSFRLAYKWTTPAAAGTCETPPSSDETIIPLDTWVTDGSTSIGSDACYVYEIAVTSGREYTFKTGCATGGTDLATADFDTWLELYDEDGTSITYNDDGCSNYTSTITWTATYTGDAFVKVRGYDSNKYGAFRLAYIKDDTPPAISCNTPPVSDEEITAAEWTAIGIDTWNTDAVVTLASDECTVYKVNQTVGKEYTFKTGCATGGSDAATADFDTYIDLYSSTGTWLRGNDDGCTEYRSTITWTATEAINYVKVRGYSSLNFGTYRVAYKYVTPTGTSSCTTPPSSDLTLAAPTLAWQTAAQVTLTSDACYVYKVAVTIDDIFTFKTGCANGASADFDSFLELYDADGVWLTQDDDECAVPASGDYSSKIEWTATYTGWAYLKVRGYNSSNYGDFTLAYSYVAGGPDAPLGIENKGIENKIQIYPNPADQSFTVVSETPLLFTRILLNEFTGRTVQNLAMDKPISNYQFESANIAPGVYVLSIETSEGWIRKKVSIVR